MVALPKAKRWIASIICGMFKLPLLFSLFRWRVIGKSKARFLFSSTTCSFAIIRVKIHRNSSTYLHLVHINLAWKHLNFLDWNLMNIKVHHLAVCPLNLVQSGPDWGKWLCCWRRLSMQEEPRRSGWAEIISRHMVTINKVITCQGISPEWMCCAVKIRGDRGGGDML